MAWTSLDDFKRVIADMPEPLPRTAIIAVSTDDYWRLRECMTSGLGGMRIESNAFLRQGQWVTLDVNGRFLDCGPKEPTT